jgi:hypothetical protein
MSKTWLVRGGVWALETEQDWASSKNATQKDGLSMSPPGSNCRANLLIFAQAPDQVVTCANTLQLFTWRRCARTANGAIRSLTGIQVA